MLRYADPGIERWPGPPPPRGWRLRCGMRAQRTSSPRRWGIHMRTAPCMPSGWTGVACSPP